jgi:hypothetical protein
LKSGPLRGHDDFNRLLVSIQALAADAGTAGIGGELSTAVLKGHVQGQTPDVARGDMAFSTGSRLARERTRRQPAS